jgi:DNA-binding cell septation regulator SpoVG
MVKRYGGVPLVTKPLDYQLGADTEEFALPRAKEKEVYDLIARDLDEAIPLLKANAGRGRINKYTAYALKSRAMLYAASIAQFGSVQLDGLVVILKVKQLHTGNQPMMLPMPSLLQANINYITVMHQINHGTFSTSFFR